MLEPLPTARQAQILGPFKKITCNRDIGQMMITIDNSSKSFNVKNNIHY
jgi:hypothetical protein